MESYNIIILIFGILLVIIFIILYFINQIFRYVSLLNKYFSTVKEILGVRALIVTSMLEFINTNLEHEKSFHKNLTSSLNEMISIKNNKEGISLLKKTEKVIFSFCKLENTYEYLSKNKDYTKIKKDILSNKEKLEYAMDTYNKGVINYNNYIENKYINILSKICRVNEFDCYKK